MYDCQMRELAKKGFRAISISLGGFGKSDKEVDGILNEVQRK
jgi:hypothetical protein